MRSWIGLFAVLMICGCRLGPPAPAAIRRDPGRLRERIVVARDGRGFMTEKSRQPFHPWGFNYGNAGRLMEDFWNEDWPTLAADFRKMRSLGANVVRIHLQFGKFMVSAEAPNREALRQLTRLLALAESSGLYLDITGLACYRPSDVPGWFKSMNEAAHVQAQAVFWEAVAATCAASPAVFCYDLINEPISPGERRAPGQWCSGKLFGGYDFVQFIALDPAGRSREEIPVAWIDRMRTAIRRQDAKTMITVGLLPWSRDWKFLSGFIPSRLAPALDFLSVHIYPDSRKPGEALEGLRQFAVGKPVVIEETFPLSCRPDELESFLRDSRACACGWMGHYDGNGLEELDALQRAGKISLSQGIYRQWMQLFVRLKPVFVPESIAGFRDASIRRRLGLGQGIGAGG
jgi:hypothetical protein